MRSVLIAGSLLGNRMPRFGRRRTYYGRRRRYRRRGTRSPVRWAAALASAAALLALLFAVLVIPQAGGPPGGPDGAAPMLDAALSDTAATVSDTAATALSNTTAAVLPLLPELPPPPPPLNASDVEYYIHLYTNEERAHGGLHPLTRVTAIDGIARGHSEDMVERRFFSHYNLEGLDQTARGEMAGYRCLKATHHGMAENIFQHNEMGRYDTSEDAARDTVSWWMDSPGHRANIMDPAYDRIGVGVAMDDRGTVYATQNFC